MKADSVKHIFDGILIGALHSGGPLTERELSMLDTAGCHQKIVVDVVEHKDTHLLVAYSKDLPGFTVAARSQDQLMRDIPLAIKEMLEASGKTGVSVEADDDDMPSGFVRRSVIANARFARA